MFNAEDRGRFLYSIGVFSYYNLLAYQLKNTKV